MWERMGGRVWFLVIIFLKNSDGVKGNIGNPNCDSSTTARFNEGNIGESGLFCWLGVLRVYFHHGDETQVALTGIVLIKNNFALGNAEDIAKIPEFVLTHDSKAMFIERDQSPIEVDVVRRYVHPDFDLYTQQSVALVELYVDNIDFNVRSVCWPTYLYNASNVLYAFGYTDENKLLEKVAYQLQYLNPTLCEEFYNKSGLPKSRRSMEMYVCGFAVNMERRCVWDSGMVMASNTTGAWIIVGLSIHGPGCAAPSRFLDIMPYLPWIHEVTKLGYGFRKSGRTPIEAIPVHELFKESRKSVVQPRLGKEDEYHLKTDTQTWLNIDRLDENAYRITPFNYRYEVDGGCSSPNRKLLYREETNINYQFDRYGSLAYKINLYDMLITGCDCIMLQVKCSARSKAVVYHSPTELDFNEGTHPETPDAVIRYFPVISKSPKGVTRPTPLPRMRPTFIRDDAIRNIAPNVNMFIRIQFKGKGKIAFEMYGRRTPPVRTRSTPGPRTTTRRGRRFGNRWRDVVNRRVQHKDFNPHAVSLPMTMAGQTVSTNILVHVLLAASICLRL